MKIKLVAAMLVLMSANAFSQQLQEMKPLKTKIQSSFKDDRIIIDDDFIGLGYVAVEVGEYADVVYDDYGVVRAKKRITIKASPGSRGTCVHAIHIARGDRIPKAIAFDTRLCPVGNSINVFSNQD